MKKVMSFAIAMLVVVLFSGIAEAFRTGDVGSEVIVVEKGDEGVWGISAGLHEKGLLTKGMTVNKAYASACLKNFGSMEECVLRSPLLKAGDELLFPFISREEYTEMVTASMIRTLEAGFKVTEEKMQQRVASLEAQLASKDRAFNTMIVALMMIALIGLGAFMFGEKTGQASAKRPSTVRSPLSEEEIVKGYSRNIAETHKGDPGG